MKRKWLKFEILENEIVNCLKSCQTVKLSSSFGKVDIKLLESKKVSTFKNVYFQSKMLFRR